MMILWGLWGLVILIFIIVIVIIFFLIIANTKRFRLSALRFLIILSVDLFDFFLIGKIRCCHC